MPPNKTLKINHRTKHEPFWYITLKQSDASKTMHRWTTRSGFLKLASVNAKPKVDESTLPIWVSEISIDKCKAEVEDRTLFGYLLVTLPAPESKSNGCLCTCMSCILKEDMETVIKLDELR